MMKMASEMMSKMTPEQVCGAREGSGSACHRSTTSPPGCRPTLSLSPSPWRRTVQMAQMERQAAAMSPEMRQQAMDMTQKMTPEQMAQLRSATAGLSGEQMVSQASANSAALSSQEQYQYDASLALKADGNRLHGAQKFDAAVAKYQRAVENLSSE